MGYRHSREELLEAALAVALEDGLSQLSFGRVARRLGISDRTVVYYFPTKDDLVGGVISSMAGRLLETLAAAFNAPATDHLALLRVAWPILAHRDADPVFALFFEANGLAAAGRDPYRTLVPQLIDAWIDWAAELVDGPKRQRRTEAEAAIAVADGLLLLRQLAGPAAAARAARRLGVA